MSATRKFGLFSPILSGINGIVGSGIFLLPGKAFAEAGGRFDKTGSPYIYAVDSAFDKGGAGRIVWGLGALVIGVPVCFAMRAGKGARTRA
ncbi:MAG TPA: hypothetical protein VMV90_14625 [Rectinemataceae bacterium]|nr:hypothetical protein [Rectinemataceae bacterium]